MNKKHLQFTRALILFIFITSFLGYTGIGQTVVFSDDFSTNTSTSWTTGGVINSSAWSVTRSGDDWGGRRNTSPAQLELINDVGATGNFVGWVFASTSTGSYSSPYDQTLGLCGGLVTWTFNMRQIRPDPAGFAQTSYGLAFVLGTTSATAATAGSGYAVVLGQSGTTDPVRLAKFTNGLQGTLTNMIVSSTAGLTDLGAEYLSVKITFDPVTGTWQFFLRNDGSTAFADPATGTLVSQGTVIDNTYTALAMPFAGAYWQGNTAAAQTSFFDNVKVTVAQSSVINVNPSSLSDLRYPLGSGPSAAKSFLLSGSELTPLSDIIKVKGTTDFEISSDSVTYNDSISVAYVSGTLASTKVYVRLRAGLAEGTYVSENIACSGGGAVTKNVMVSGEVYKTEPNNNPSGLSATTVSYSHNTVTLSWTDATGTVLPAGYLVKGSTTGFSSISSPVDGTVVTDGGLNKNIAQGTQTYTFTGLTPSTSYYFKIFPFSNSGTDINYKTDGTVPTSVTTTIAAPVGSIDSPYSCDQAITNNTGTDKWVLGYIAGYVVSSTSVDLTPPFTSAQNTNIAIADDMFETDIAKMLFVQLPDVAIIRPNLNLYDNLSNYHKRIVLRGDLMVYFTPHKGMQNTDDYRWYEPTSSIAAANWNVSSLWSTGIPYLHDNVTLNNTVTVTAGAQCNDLTIGSEGKQVVNNGQTLIINGTATIVVP